MLWKLLITVIAFSDTGSVSTFGIASDYRDGASCSILERKYNRTVEPEILGHKYKIVGTATCSPNISNDRRMVRNGDEQPIPNPVPDLGVGFPFNMFEPDR